MRDLNECQTEVFRRSEKRIKERKQRRKHILMACIPLVLCITMFIILPAMMPAGSSDKKAAPESSNEQYTDGTGEDGMTGLPVGSVEVSVKGFSDSYISFSVIALIVLLIAGGITVFVLIRRRRRKTHS